MMGWHFIMLSRKEDFSFIVKFNHGDNQLCYQTALFNAMLSICTPYFVRLQVSVNRTAHNVLESGLL